MHGGIDVLLSTARTALWSARSESFALFYHSLIESIRLHGNNLKADFSEPPVLWFTSVRLSGEIRCIDVGFLVSCFPTANVKFYKLSPNVISFYLYFSSSNMWLRYTHIHLLQGLRSAFKSTATCQFPAILSAHVYWTGHTFHLVRLFVCVSY